MTRYRILLLLLCATGIPFIVANAWPKPEDVAAEGFTVDDPKNHKDELIKYLGGPEGVDIILHADRVEAFRINPADDSRSPSIQSYRVDVGPIAVPAAMRREMSKLLTRPEYYGWGYKVGCIPSYAVRLSFSRGQDRVDVNICYSCGMMEFVKNGETTGGALIGSSQKRLTGFAKQLFPEDEAIQGL